MNPFGRAKSQPFNSIFLALALQRMLNIEDIRLYVLNYPDEVIRGNINSPVVGCPPIFYAAARNESKAIQMLVEFGADPNSWSVTWNVPVLAFAIFQAVAGNQSMDTTNIVKTLLGAGAYPTMIPRSLWEDYTKTPELSEKATRKGIDPSWCNAAFRCLLARTLNLSQRYYLWKANSLKPASARTKQIALAYNIIPLLEIPFHIIGQSIATDTILSRVFGYLALNKKKPMVIVFAGPSGHGKTELARQMETLLSCSAITVDCTEMRHETDIFGAKHPYVGAEQGSKVNNFLAENTGRQSIVFLDEFEKSTSDAWNALLLPFDSGSYRDRRNGTTLDCSNTIWIIATNLVDSVIDRFFIDHLQNKDHNVQNAPLQDLDSMIKKQFAATFKAPLTGRISIVVPFFPFQAGEQAVVASKFMLDFARLLRGPIDLEKKRFIGHLELQFENDTEVARFLAETGYERGLGARSLARVVEQLIETPLAYEYVQGNDEITMEMNDGPLQRYTVKVVRGRDGQRTLIVVREKSITVVDADEEL
ncbi:MAG: hypothetical protein Q9187_000770 [Circinaria calcarea]